MTAQLDQDQDEREPALDPHLEQPLDTDRDVSKNAVAYDGDARDDEDEEFAEEDAWLHAGHFLDDTNSDDVPDAAHYTPQLMDVRAMNSLRASLRKSEAQIELCGRMREFVPRKPAVATTNGPAFMGFKRCGHARGQSRSDDAACETDTSVTSDLGQRHPVPLLSTSGPTRAFLTAAPSTVAIAVPPSLSHRKEDFAVVLHRELHQLRDLEYRYDEAKRMLLEQMDIICSLKPSERSGGPETYEKLAELMAFIVECKAPS